MKTIILFTICSFSYIVSKAQLSNTKWKGSLHTDTEMEILLDFKTDTLFAYTTADNQITETMIYTVKDTVLTLQKITGQSDCDSAAIGKYAFRINNDGMTLILVDDDCDGRGEVLDNTTWMKQQ
jgi:hypothetical protein